MKCGFPLYVCIYPQIVCLDASSFEVRQIVCPKVYCKKIWYELWRSGMIFVKFIFILHYRSTPVGFLNIVFI